MSEYTGGKQGQRDHAARPAANDQKGQIAGSEPGEPEDQTQRPLESGQQGYRPDLSNHFWYLSITP